MPPLSPPPLRREGVETWVERGVARIYGISPFGGEGGGEGVVRGGIPTYGSAGSAAAGGAMPTYPQPRLPVIPRLRGPERLSRA